ncbi:hypothetical protein ACVIHH_003604 [Bradyrhizobium sp. USDA 4518]
MKRVLVAYSASSTHVPTTFEYLSALSGLPDCEVSFVHCTNGARLDFDLNDFDVLINSYCVRLCYHDWYLSPDYIRAVCGFRGLKIAIAQDEYDRTALLHAGLRHLGFHVLFSSVPPRFWPLVYPAIDVPGLALKPLLTGYAPAQHPDRIIKPLNERTIPIGYRGREIAAQYGRLGFEKYEIGRYMAEFCDRIGLPHSIRTDEGSRIYGEDWFKFIGDCRSMLGSESGSNAFDFDQAIEQKCASLQAANERPVKYADFSDFVTPFEKPFDCGQISPRAFECASMKTPMILFRGRYSDMLQAGVHYIALEKDFSNAHDVIAQVNNLDHLQQLAERAHVDLITSGSYSYRVLTSAIAEAIGEHLPRIASDPSHQHRKSVRQPWRFPHDSSKPESIALRECPTESPQLQEYYFAKHAWLEDLKSQAAWLPPAAELPPTAELAPTAELQPRAELLPTSELPPAAELPPTAELPATAEATMRADASAALVATSAPHAMPVRSTIFLRAARRAWHMLPEIVRHRVGRAIVKSNGG